ncbi:hypothetical protein LCGC14_1732130, partial [marine sediment metagenome]
MKGKVNIVCVYWIGNFRGRDFVSYDVWRLYYSVLKHADRPFDFYVLTNDMEANVPGTKIELLHGNDWPGWWAKMELYRPDLPAGRTLYMDLDSHVIYSLQPIFDFEGDLVLFDSQDTSRYQAATILFNATEFTWLYDKFKED